MIFITSDLHFAHNRPFLYEPRGYTSIEEHDADIIRKWNEVVGEDDEVYVLGDLMLNDNVKGAECLKQLNGRIHIVRGNHCTDARLQIYHDLGFTDLGYASVIKYKHRVFYLSHYPTITCPHDFERKMPVVNLCGHTHTNDPFYDWDKGMIYHCELDAHGCAPVALDDIIADIQRRKENDN